MSLMLAFFASLGTFFLSVVLVIAAMAALPCMIIITMEQVQRAFFSKMSDRTIERLGNHGVFWGIVGGMVWTIWAICTAGLVTAFLSVISICGVLFIVALISWFVDEMRPRQYPPDYPW